MEVAKQDGNGSGDDIAMTDTMETIVCNVQEKFSENHVGGNNLDIENDDKVIGDFSKETDSIEFQFSSDISHLIDQESNSHDDSNNLNIGKHESSRELEKSDYPEEIEPIIRLEIDGMTEGDEKINSNRAFIDELDKIQRNDDVETNLREDCVIICTEIFEEILENAIKIADENCPQMEENDHETDSDTVKNISSPTIVNKTKWWKLVKPAKKTSKEKPKKTFWRKFICCY